MKSGTVSKVFDSCMGVLQKSYGKEGAKITGFKEVWIDEFIGNVVIGVNSLMDLVENENALTCKDNIVTIYDKLLGLH